MITKRQYGDEWEHRADFLIGKYWIDPWFLGTLCGLLPFVLIGAFLLFGGGHHHGCE